MSQNGALPPSAKNHAKRLVDDMTEEWDPSQYKNTYHDDLMKRIEEKVKAGQATEITKPSKEGTHKSAQVIDLAELLKQSLGGGTAKKPVKRAAASHAKRKRA